MLISWFISWKLFVAVGACLAPGIAVIISDYRQGYYD